MSHSTTLLEQITTAQASKEVTANQLFDAHSPASLFGRHAETSVGLVWGYYGGSLEIDGLPTNIANGTVTLSASSVNYVERTRAGVVSKNTTAFTAGSVPLYTVTTGTGTVTSYTDHREAQVSHGVEGRLSLSVAGSSNVTLTAGQARNSILNFTGILTGSINVVVPNGPQQWTVSNNTTGAFTLTVKTSAGTGVAVTQASTVRLVADGTNVVGLAAAVGGLQYVAEALNSSSPNATITAVSLAATQAATNVDLIVKPKGSGALQRDVADSTSTGGNKRGTYAVDWQGSRSTAAQAATGNGAHIGGGVKNTASGTNSVVAGGDENTASGSTSAVPGGYLNTASGSFSTAWGHDCTADGYGSTAFGFAANARGLNGVEAFSSGLYSNKGEFQSLRMMLGARTTTNTQTTLDSQSAGSVNTTNQMTLPNNSALVVKGLVVGRQNATGDTATWEFTAAIRRGASAATTAMLAACTPVAIAADAGAAAWALAVDADTTNGCLRIRVTGENSKTILWTCLIVCVQTQG
jgi:hypothetical protein